MPRFPASSPARPAARHMAEAPSRSTPGVFLIFRPMLGCTPKEGSPNRETEQAEHTPTSAVGRVGMQRQVHGEERLGQPFTGPGLDLRDTAGKLSQGDLSSRGCGAEMHLLWTAQGLSPQNQQGHPGSKVAAVWLHTVLPHPCEGTWHSVTTVVAGFLWSYTWIHLLLQTTRLLSQTLHGTQQWAAFRGVSDNPQSR